MKNVKTFLFMAMLALFCAACGNDPEVEAKFVDAIEKGIVQLQKSQSSDDLVRSQDLIDKAYEIPGVEELSVSGKVEEVLGRLDTELDSARQRVMDNLEKELNQPDTIPEEE